MTKYRCDKEVEITEMHSDIKYIKKAITGNGEKGILKEVADNRDFRIGIESNKKLLIGAMGSGWLITLLALGMHFIG